MLFIDLEMEICKVCGYEISECCCNELAFTAKEECGKVITCDECDKYCCTECSRYNTN